MCTLKQMHAPLSDNASGGNPAEDEIRQLRAVTTREDLIEYLQAKDPGRCACVRVCVCARARACVCVCVCVHTQVHTKKHQRMGGEQDHRASTKRSAKNRVGHLPK